MGRLATAAIIVAFMTCGCTYQNKPLNSIDATLDATLQNHTRASTRYIDSPTGGERGDRNHDGCFVGLAISGGGSRSAVFAAANMIELDRLGLLQKVDYISAVSGGSLPAAFYCVSGNEWNTGNVQRKMSHSFASDVVLQLIQPWIYLTVVFSDYDRSDLLANSFKNNLFTRDGKVLTFADLRSDRPRLLLNATDLQSGHAFVFTDEQFDELNSDLSKFPLSYACAASSAVPVVMHQVTLRDFSTVHKQYRHLIDGGVNDNLGIVSLLQTYQQHRKQAEAAGLPDPYPRGAVFLVVDARTRFDAQLGDKGDVGLLQSLATGAGLTSSALLNRVSTYALDEIVLKFSPDNVTAKQLHEQIAGLEKTGYLELSDRNDRPVRVVHLGLSRLSEIENLPFQSFSEKVNSVQTYFDISASESFNLIQAARLIIRDRFEPKLLEIERQIDANDPSTGPSSEPTDLPATRPLK